MFKLLCKIIGHKSVICRFQGTDVVFNIKLCTRCGLVRVLNKRAACAFGCRYSTIVLADKYTVYICIKCGRLLWF